jgi:N-acetyl-alpha-D-muramate 1-phosphate uridylyltransferase
MDAMILAAGLGTRLRTVTRDLPKALVDVGGKPMIRHVAESLIAAGADRLIINVHHYADLIIDYVRSCAFGVEVLFSREIDAPLETGGGLRHAAHLFRRDAPFLLHNVDVLTDANLRGLYAAHIRSRALATLAVNRRDTRRYLIFDEEGLCGRLDIGTVRRAEVHAPWGEIQPHAFAGIHVISPPLLDLITEQGAFSILELYFRLTREAHRILYYDISDADWLEIGNLERLAVARERFARARGA